MNARRFSLKPFLTAALPPDLKITGNVSRSSHIFAITYMLIGPLSKLLIPSHTGNPLRRKGLWEETCFEFFVAEKDLDSYREFNLSPSGDWNVYCFPTYRQGMSEEMRFSALPFSVEARTDFLKLSLEVDLTALIPGERELVVGVSAIIKSIDGSMSFWALTHPGPQPDFHRRDSFIIEV